MASKTVLKMRLEQRKAMLEECYKAYSALLSGGVKSYAIGSRNLTRFDIDELWDMIKTLESEVDQLESQLAGGGRRKAVGVIPRDI